MGNGMLSQEEIDALLRGTLEPEPAAGEALGEDPLSEMEKDALGEIANISMGTAATTLSLLLNKKVEITTPKVDITSSEQLRHDYPVPAVIVNVKYKAGLEGSNLLILSQHDGAVIVDLMMGGTGASPSEILSELQISGISEAMNQMMGSAATSMSQMFNSLVDITPPQLVLRDLSADADFMRELNMGEPLVRISFRMVVENVIDSILVQIVPLNVAKKMAGKLLGAIPDTAAAGSQPPTAQPIGSMSPGFAAQGLQSSPSYGQAPSGSSQYGPGDSQPAGGGYGGLYGAPPPPPGGYHGGAGFGPGSPTTVQPAQFAPLQPSQPAAVPDNLNLILDVPLQVSVELGKARKTIKEILEMGPGSVIELDRLAGEPVDMIVNGKLIAKCEVVVINETFGIRITDIVQPAERMKTLN